MIRFVIAFVGAAFLLSPSPVWAQSWEFVRLPAESNFSAYAQVYLEPADSGEPIEDSETVSGSAGNGYVANAFAARNSALSVMESDLAILPDAPSISMTGYAAGSIGTVWPGQFGDGYFANNAVSVYRFETTDISPEAKFTLKLNSYFTWSGYINTQGSGGIAIYKGIGTNGPLLYSASLALNGNDVLIRTPNGIIFDSIVGGTYSIVDEVIATDIQDGDYFTVVGGQDGHEFGITGMVNATCHWNATVTSHQQLD